MVSNWFIWDIERGCNWNCWILDCGIALFWHVGLIHLNFLSLLF